MLVKLQAKYAARGLQVVGIATDEPNAQGVRAFMKQTVVNYPILMGTRRTPAIIAAFGGEYIGLPYTILLARNGKVLKIHAGELSPLRAEDWVRQALERPTQIPAVRAGKLEAICSDWVAFSSEHRQILQIDPQSLLH